MHLCLCDLTKILLTLKNEQIQHHVQCGMIGSSVEKIRTNASIQLPGIIKPEKEKIKINASCSSINRFLKHF